LTSAPDTFLLPRQGGPTDGKLAGPQPGRCANCGLPAAAFRGRPDAATILVDHAKEGDMGSLIPIGGGADAEIKTYLNAAFDDNHIAIVKGVVANENLFDDGHHHLHRVAYRLGTYPVKAYPNDNAQGKWFYFLKKTLKDAKYNGEHTTASITKILLYALKNSGNSRTSLVKRVVFDAKPGPNSTDDHHVDPNNPTLDDDIAALVDSTGTLRLTLICPKSLDDIAIPIPNKQADLDRDDQGNIIEKQPIKIFTPADLGPPKLSKTKRTSPKKTKKKRTPRKKTGGKKAKKKASKK
jgi:hypothetical protein